jgi:hypothetical protein
MPRTARLTSALRGQGRGKALAFVGAAAALAGIGTGTANAATASTAAQPTAITRTAPPNATPLGGSAASASLAAAAASTSAPSLRAAAPSMAAAPSLAQAAANATPYAVPAHAPAAHVQVTPATQHQAQHQASAPHQAAAQPATPSGPYRFYDSVTPSEIPAGHEVATYATGPFAVRASQVTGRNVLWIDTQGTDPSANVLDVEPGDATPQMAATWAHSRLSEHPDALACIYTMQSDWSAARSAISTLPSWMQSHVRWWIADPTGAPHILPGATATQWYWGSNYDESSANGAL